MDVEMKMKIRFLFFLVVATCFSLCVMASMCVFFFFFGGGSSLSFRLPSSNFLFVLFFAMSGYPAFLFCRVRVGWVGWWCNSSICVS